MNIGKEAKRRLVTIAIVGSVTIGGMTVVAAAHSGGTSAQAAAPPPPPGSSSKHYTGTAKYMQRGGTAARANQTYSATATDESGVLVSKGGALTLTNSKIRTTGNTRSVDDSSFYGLNAAVLAQSRSSLTLAKSSVTTSGTGANGVFATGSGTAIHLSAVTIKAVGAGSHGVDATWGASLTLKDVTISTSGRSAAAIATDRGGGTVTVTGGTMTTSGFRSPGIYSTGAITVSGARLTATGAEGAVVEGGNSITLTNTTLKGAKNRGVMLYNSMSGDAVAGTGTFTMNGGSLTAATGPAFYVTNTKAVITLKGGAKVGTRSGNLVLANSTGTGSGNTGPGRVAFVADGETLTGSLIADSTSTLTATLRDHTTLTGMIRRAALTLDSTSTWNLMANSVLTSLTGAKISGSSITNIVGHGHTVTYRESLAANQRLGGKTYTLAGGGRLVAV